MTQPESLSLGSNAIRRGLIQRISVRMAGKRAKDMERFIKFLFVGALGALIDLGITNFLMRFVFHVQDGEVPLVVLSAAIGFTCAVSSNFIWNRYWTYPDSRSRSVRRQLAIFFFVSAIGLIIRAVMVGALTTPFGNLVKSLAEAHLIEMEIQDSTLWKIGANLAILLALGVVMGWNFLANRLWTYNDVES